MEPIVGDVDGNGIVDIDDVNALVNIMLDFKTPGDYNGQADITGDGNCDIDDLNEVINIMLAQ